jgi:hypothetical protein
MYCMFVSSEFNQDISMWKINNKCRTDKMLNDCPIEDKYKYKPFKNGKRI